MAPSLRSLHLPIRPPAPRGRVADQDTVYREHWRTLAQAHDGAAHGPASGPRPLTWVVLGDSAAVGLGAASVEETYVAQVAARLEAETGRAVRVINLAVSGAMAKDVLADQLPLLPATDVDAVTCVVGGNDVTWAWRFRVERFAAPLEEIAARLPAGSTLGLIAQFRIPPFEARVRRANAAVRGVAARHAHGIADIHTTTARTGLRHQLSRLSADRFHPNAAGYRDWADAVYPEVLRQVREAEARG